MKFMIKLNVAFNALCNWLAKKINTFFFSFLCHPRTKSNKPSNDLRFVQLPILDVFSDADPTACGPQALSHKQLFKSEDVVVVHMYNVVVKE